MLHELTPHAVDRARHLFDGCEYSLAIQAAIEGNNPGRIFVDNVDQPQTAFALTVEGYFLVGRHDNPETNYSLRRFLQERIFSRELYVNDDRAMSLGLHPASWEAKLPELIPTHEAEKVERYHYLCRTLRFDWRSHVPDGYTVRRVDRDLLDDAQIVFPEPMRDWMDLPEQWGTVNNFLAKGVSYAVLHGQEVVCWCAPDCVARDQIEVGIITHPAHRGRGLAAVTVAATVEHCLGKSAFSAVGWHCDADNTGSWKTAEKVGFVRSQTYAAYYYVYDLVDHLAELGWYFYRRGEYAKTVRYYEQVFALRQENPENYYDLMALAQAKLTQARLA